jgi:Putative lumazine-binding
MDLNTESSGSDIAGLTSAIGRYFDGFYGSDAEKLGEVFDPAATLFLIERGVLRSTPVGEYLALVKSREPVNLHPRVQRIVSITFAGLDVAVARVSVANAAADFDDCLTMVRLNEGWRIVAKAYLATPKQ